MPDYTTPPPPLAIEDFVPELSEFAHTTTRLHPHPVTTDLPAEQSKIGGTFLWPRDEPWPMCSDQDIPFVPIVQLRSDDFPDVPFMPGTDLFQLLWTPYREESTYLPRPIVFWRSVAEIVDPLPACPNLADYGLDLKDWKVSDNIPNACTIHPENVIEFPDPDQLYWWAGTDKARKLLDQIAQADIPIPDEASDLGGTATIEDVRKSFYWTHLSQCPGAKVGGGGSFERDGLEWEHFMTLPSWEYDAGSYFRWQPIEDRWENRQIHFEDLKQPMGMHFGRTQDLQIWICRQAVLWEIKMNISGG